MGDERGGEADDGAVEGCDEDLGVRVEGVCDFEVVAGYVAEGVAVDVGGGGGGAADGEVGARGEVAADAGEDGDGDVGEDGDGAEELGEVVIEVLG